LTPDVKGRLAILAFLIRPPGNKYGAETRYLLTVEAMTRKHISVIPVTNEKLISMMKLPASRVFPVKLTTSPQSILSERLYNYYQSLKMALSIVIKPLEIDLVVAFDGNLLDMFVSFVSSQIIRKPFVVLVHHARGSESTMWKDYPKTVRRRGLKAATVLTVGRIIQRFIAKRSTLIMAVSRASRNEYSRYWGIPSSHIFVTANGPNIMVQNLIPIKERKIDVLYVGRFSPSKGIDLLPLICEQLVHKYPNLRMVAVGGSNTDLTSIQKKIAELRLERNFEIKGYLPDSELEKIVEDSKIFIMPSYYEGFSIATLEAMCAGCVCIVSDIPSLKQIYSPVAIFATKGDINSFAQQIDILLSQPDKMERISTKSKEFSRRYDWNEIIGREIMIYRRIAFYHKNRRWVSDET
jgi:glycosyltransferase involved in cell wall biosynthesis